MMVAGPDLRFFYVSTTRPGSVNNVRVLRLSSLAERWNAGWRPFPNAVILGDSGYGLSSWLITPLLCGEHNHAEHRFNCAHRRTRCVVECAFGVLKQRFACLTKLRLTPTFAAQVIITCCIFHNISLSVHPLPDDEIQELLNEMADNVRLNEHGLEDEAEEADDDEIEEVGMQRRRNQLISSFI